MKLVILSRSKKIYSTEWLVEAAEKRGHEVKVIDVLKCYVNITANKPDIYYKHDFEKSKLEFDAVLDKYANQKLFEKVGGRWLPRFEVQ
jgi:ribosomal protein S6--L-glutamate ligase